MNVLSGNVGLGSRLGLGSIPVSNYLVNMLPYRPK